MRAIDITNQRFGNLVAQEFIPTPGKKGKWKCLCDCGNEKMVYGSDLRAGKITTCGCKINIIKKEEIGKKYGWLQVIDQDPHPAKTFADNCVHWICKCLLCSSEVSISGRNLRNGQTISCGCLKSRGEQVIIQILKEEKIPYKREISFENLKSEKNKKLRFDFGIYEKDDFSNLLFLIEFQGEQHFKPYSKGDSNLEYRQECDLLKEDYVGENHLHLLCFNKGAKNPFLQKEEIKKEILCQYEKDKRENKGGKYLYGKISYYDLWNI